MNTYEITYSFNGGDAVTVEKAGATKTAAKKALWRQLGSRYVEVLKIEQVK